MWGVTTEAQVSCEIWVLQIRKDGKAQFPRLIHPIYRKYEEPKEKNKIKGAQRKGRAH